MLYYYRTIHLLNYYLFIKIIIYYVYFYVIINEFLLFLFQVILNLLFVYYNYNKTVLRELPTNWFVPLSWLVRWPSSQVGTMSFVFWYSITNCVAKVTTNNIL